MRSKQIQVGGQYRWVLVFDTGDEVIAQLEDFAREQALRASHFTAIGAFRRALLGYFDIETKRYLETPVETQVEVLALNGFITESDDGPSVHGHVTLGRADGMALGGHLLEGVVRPTLELVVSEAPHELRRKRDPTTGLPLIDLGSS